MAERPLPALTKVSADFWAGTLAGELRLQRCAECATIRYPPMRRCPGCLSEETEPVAVSGLGRLWSWTVLHQRYFPAFEVPYPVAMVKLDEGPLVISTVAGVPAGELRCDMRLRVAFRPQTASMALPVFEPA